MLNDGAGCFGLPVIEFDLIRSIDELYPLEPVRLRSVQNVEIAQGAIALIDFPFQKRPVYLLHHVPFFSFYKLNR